MEGLIMDTKPILVSTPRGDKSPFDDFWKIKRSELEAFKYIYSVVNKFYVRRPKGKECVCHDFTKLVTMSEREFESLPHTENYEIANLYREAMRSTPRVEKLLRQRRK